MSLELKIEALTQAVEALTKQLQSATVTPAAPVAQAVLVKEPEVAPAPAAPVMPAPPAFVAPAPAPVASGAPFSDPKGLIDYVMGAYKAMGPQKGAQIQQVLTSLGYSNINDVKPEDYAKLFSGVEALKAA